MNIKKEIMEDQEQKLLGSLNLFASEILLHGYTPENHQAFTKRILEDFSQALTRIEEAAREEMVKEFGIVLDKINQGLREESPYKREILFKDAKDIMSSLSPSEEKELGNHTKECSFIKYDTGVCDCSKKGKRGR